MVHGAHQEQGGLLHHHPERQEREPGQREADPQGECSAAEERSEHLLHVLQEVVALRVLCASSKAVAPRHRRRPGCPARSRRKGADSGSR
eukprot:8285520-Alexandrium_andersonii.AAC.1